MGTGVGGTPIALLYAQVILRLTDGQEHREWPAWVGFAPIQMNRALLGFAGCLESKIKIIANCVSIYTNDPVVRRQLDLRGQTGGRDLGNNDARTAELCYCRCDGKLVHSETS